MRATDDVSGCLGGECECCVNRKCLSCGLYLWNGTNPDTIDEGTLENLAFLQAQYREKKRWRCDSRQRRMAKKDNDTFFAITSDVRMTKPQPPVSDKKLLIMRNIFLIFLSLKFCILVSY